MITRNKLGFFVTAASFMVVSFFVQTAVSAEPRYGGTLRIGTYVAQTPFLDARYSTLRNFCPTASMIYDPLFGWGQKGFESLVPYLATAMESKSSTVRILHLRKGVKFHNGREMTSEDVKANLDWRIKKPDGWKPLSDAYMLKDIAKVEVVDKYTLEITMERPFPQFMRTLEWVVKGIAPPEEIEKWGDNFGSHPCGTGPFKVAEINTKEDKVVLERFDGYWGPKPYVDRIEYHFIRSDDARLIALEKGELDIAYLLDEAKPLLERNPNLTYTANHNPNILRQMFFNVRRWPMSDVRFRKAIWMGADWKNILPNAYAFKSGTQARTLLEYTKFFNPDALKLVPSYDPKEASKLIQAVEKDAGKKIPPIYVLDLERTIATNVNEALKIQLAQIGVPLDLHHMSTSLWSQKLRKDTKLEWDMGGYAPGYGIEPTMGFVFFESDSASGADGKSLGGYSNRDFDKWVSKSKDANIYEEMLKCYHEAEKILLQDVAVIPLYPSRQVLGYKKKVKNFTFTEVQDISVTSPWTNVWLEQ